MKTPTAQDYIDSIRVSLEDIERTLENPLKPVSPDLIRFLRHIDDLTAQARDFSA